MPDELKKKKGKGKVDLLDDGYFGTILILFFYFLSFFLSTSSSSSFSSFLSFYLYSLFYYSYSLIGNGMYFSIYSDYAMWYSEERESDEILLSALLQGEPFQCTARMDGQGCQKGYDSQISPSMRFPLSFLFSSCILTLKDFYFVVWYLHWLSLTN
jgi:hypothetical protein